MNEEEIKEVLKGIEGNLTCLRNYTGTGKCVAVQFSTMTSKRKHVVMLAENYI